MHQRALELRVARRKSRLFRPAHLMLRASLAPLPYLARPSRNATPSRVSCPWHQG